MTGLLRRDSDFRLLWGSEVSGKLGAAATSVVLPLAALDAGPFRVSLLAAATWLPWLVFGLAAGAWVDRLPRRPIMLAAAAVSLGAFVGVRAAAGAGVFGYGWLLGAALLTGVAAVFFQVAYTAYLPTLLGPDDLAEGNAKLQGSASAAQIVGQSSGGLLVQVAGPLNALLVNAGTFAVSLGCLLGIRKPEPRPVSDRRSLVGEIREGLRLVVRDPFFRAFTVYGAIANLFLMGYQTILVVFLARDVGLSSGAVGVLIAVANVGGIVGALVARRVADVIGTARAALAFAVLGTLPVLLIPLTFAGVGTVLCAIGGVCTAAAVVANNVLKASFQQRYCPPALLGRLYATASFLALGALPLGALAGGALASRIGVRPALWVMVAGVPVAGVVLVCSPIRRGRDLPEHAALWR
ncbi:MFS transporter [Cryptosporangium phraense]|uniref:MFS transporter n=1 Tax=Cryptosporangium phraense TaxID=2593070 RepID=A0A545AFI2_9ACTN|nr:MFS transporter [Cryptosporangium phraense]TQS40092.1 MFS transporter [Cryptosporangium phraense]